MSISGLTTVPFNRKERRARALAVSPIKVIHPEGSEEKDSSVNMTPSQFSSLAAMCDLNQCDTEFFSSCIERGFKPEKFLVNHIESRVKASVSESLVVQHRRTHVIDYSLTNAQIREFRRANPSLNLAVKKYADDHPHPLLNDERSRLEKFAYSFLQTEFGNEVKVIDIGGNPKRHHTHQRNNVWSCCPILDGPDLFRDFFNRKVTRKCRHTVQECCCLDPDVYLSVDSIYYLSPLDIANLCLKSSKNFLLAVHHVFNDAFGSFAAGEAKYIMKSRTVVSMSVLGNGMPYEHSNLHWMHDNVFHFEHQGKTCTLAWIPLLTKAYTVITMFKVFPGKLAGRPSSTCDFGQALAEPTFYGSSNLSSALNQKAEVAVPGEIADFHNVDIYSWGSFIILTRPGTVSSFITPKSFVNDIAAYCAGRRRTPDSLMNAIAYARTSAKRFNFPSELASSSIMLCAALGFVMHLPLELAILHSVIKPMKALSVAHEDALNFKFKHVFTWKQVAIAVAIGCATVGVASACVVAPHLLAPAAKALTAGLSTVAAYKLVKSYSQRHPAPYAQYCDDRSSLPLANRSISLKTTVVLPATDVLSNQSELMAREIDITAAIQPGDEFQKHAQPVPQIAAGIVSTVSIPIVPSANATSSLAAIITRQIKPQGIHLTSGEPDLVAELNEYVTLHHDEFSHNTVDNPIVPSDFSDWLKQFTASQAKRLARARSDLNAAYDERANEHGPFPKLEGLQKSDTQGLSSLDPRLILACHDKHNVQTGPFFKSASKAMCSIFNPSVPFGFVYTSGLDAEQIGRYFAESFQNSRRVVAEGDFVRFDSSIHAGLIRIENGYHQRCGAPQYVVDSLERSVNTTGTDRFNNRFVVLGTRPSGAPNTSCGNTLIQIFAETFCLARQIRRPGQPLPSPREVWHAFEVRGLVLGDDSLLVLNEFFLPQQYVDDLFKLGLHMEMKIHSGPQMHYEATFCSSRFYPVTRSDGIDCVVLAPPIGRVLAKAGYYTAPPALIDPLRLVKGDATSRHQSSHCIPFLNEYWKHSLRLSNHVDAWCSADMKRRDKYNAQLDAKYKPNNETWAMIDHLYGLTKDDLVVFDRALSQINSLPHILDMTMFSRAFSVDSASPNRDENLPPVCHDVLTATAASEKVQETKDGFLDKMSRATMSLFAAAGSQTHFDPLTGLCN